MISINLYSRVGGLAMSTLSNQVSSEILVLEYKSQSICKRDIFVKLF